MEYLNISLKIVYDLIKPFFQDLIKEKSKKMLRSNKSSTFRSHVYYLFTTIRNFEESVNKFVDELSELVKTFDERGYKHYEFITQIGKVNACGNDVVSALARLESALELLDPELEIYAEDVRFKMLYADALEHSIFNSYTRESQRVVSPNRIDFTNLKSVLEDARINLELIRQAVEELRKFIKANIPLKLE